MEDQQILAVIENFGTVTVCPGGIIHVNLPHLSVKLLPSEFAKFHELILKAHVNYSPPQRPSGKPKLQLVCTEVEEGDPKPE